MVKLLIEFVEGDSSSGGFEGIRWHGYLDLGEWAFDPHKGVVCTGDWGIWYHIKAILLGWCLLDGMSDNLAIGHWNCHGFGWASVSARWCWVVAVLHRLRQYKQTHSKVSGLCPDTRFTVAIRMSKYFKNRAWAAGTKSVTKPRCCEQAVWKPLCPQACCIASFCAPVDWRLSKVMSLLLLPKEKWLKLRFFFFNKQKKLGFYWKVITNLKKKGKKN